MKKMMGPFSVGLIMGASVAGAYFMMPKMKNMKKVMSPYMSNLISDQNK